MVFIERDWYTIEGLAEKLDCKVDDINHLIQAGKINPVFWFENQQAMIDCGNGETYDIGINGLWACLGNLRYPMGYGANPIAYSIDVDDPYKGFYEAFPVTMDSLEEAIEYRRERQKEALSQGVKKETYWHIIRHSETDKYLITLSVVRFCGDSETAKKVILKSDFERLKSGVNQTKEATLASLLDLNHPWHSKELAMGVEAWSHLYSNHEGHRNSNDHKPHGGHSAMIREYLELNYDKETTTTAIERVAMVTNPSMVPGPGKVKKWIK